MLTFRTIIAAGLLILAGTSLSFAADEAPSAQDTNAALRYWQVFAQVSEQAAQTLSGVTAENLLDPAWRPSDELLTAAETVPENLLFRAAMTPRCDFGVDFEADGFLATMPHMAPMRTVVRAEVVRALAEAAAGKPDQLDSAIRRLTAALGTARHASQEDVLIGALVSARCFEMVDAGLQRIQRDHALTAAHRESLRSALAQFDATDPFRIRASLESERRMSIAWLERVALSGRTPEAMRAIDAFGLTPEKREKALALLDDKPTVRRGIEALNEYYEIGLRVLGTEGADEALKKLPSMLDDSWSSFLAPSLSAAHRQFVRSRAAFAATLERVN
jgi:hypothetical protein